MKRKLMRVLFVAPSAYTRSGAASRAQFRVCPGRRARLACRLPLDRLGAP